MRQLMASRALAAVALLWVFAAGAATAQSAQSGTETLRVFLDEMVVTATRAPQPLDTQIRNTSILNKHDVEFVRHTHISELLNRLPGVNLHRNNGQESLTAIRSPVLTGGAGAGSFLYLEDGIPMRAAGFANVNGLFEAHTEQAGSIEVVRGPGSALYGSNAVHGLINVITPSASEPGARIDLSGGSFGRRRGKFSASGTHNGVGLFGSLTLDSEDGFRDEAGLDQQKLSLRADTEHGDDKFTFIVAAQNLNQETAGFVRGPDAYKDKDLVTTNPNPAAFRDARSVRASARWEHTVDANKKLAVTPYARWNEMDFILHFLPGGALEDSGHRSVGVQNTFYWDLDDGHRVVAGVDVEATDGYLKEIQSVPGFGSFPEGVHYNYDVFALVAAPYLHAEWMLMENVTLTTGARFEYTHYDYNNKTAADTIGRFKRPADRTDSYFAATPKVGFAWKTDEETSFYGNYSRGARAPQTSDLYRLQRNQDVGEIKEEKIDSFELGIRGERHGVSYQVAGYYMKKKNFFFRDTDGFNVINGRTKHHGIEAEVVAPLPHGFALAMGGTYARHTYDFDNTVAVNSTESIKRGDDVDTAPRFLSNVRLMWECAENALVEFEWSRIGSYFTDASNLHKYPGHNVFNFRGHWQIQPALRIYGAVTNLTNKRYAERADFSFGTERYLPAESRAFQVGFALDF